MPARGERAGLRLAIADHAAGEEIGIVEHRAVGVQERIAELSPFVDGARRLGRDVAGNAAGKRELREQPRQPWQVPADRRIDLRVRALEVRVRDDARSAVARPGDEDRVRGRARE